MRLASRTNLVGSFLFVLVTIHGTSPVHAQMTSAGASRSLGGYGGDMADAGRGMGMGGPAIPYSGRFGGFMPYRMGGSGSLSFQTRGPSSTGPTRTSFGLSPMTPMSAPMGSGAGTRIGGGMSPMTGPRGMGVMPPSFGYPFRQPPSLNSPSYSGMGTSM